ncbi:MAG TPA: hypothetical protein VI864_04970 [Candidatus Bathyarchaeia archaeon]|nr:hypothetical protein [Candidatus Bathyarchaeia archaeon]
MSSPHFEKFLLEAVDEGLASLGESSKQAIYFHIEKTFNIQKQEIPNRIEAFTCAIEKIFGLGATFLESLILKGLYEKAGLNTKEGSFKDLAFTETVIAVKRMMEQ